MSWYGVQFAIAHAVSSRLRAIIEVIVCSIQYMLVIIATKYVTSAHAHLLNKGNDFVAPYCIFYSFVFENKEKAAENEAMVCIIIFFSRATQLWE